MRTSTIVIGIVSVAIGFAVQLALEARHKVDSLGIWYTVIGGAVLGLFLFVLALGIRALARRVGGS